MKTENNLLIEQNLHLVSCILGVYRIFNENIPCMSYGDLYQEGCMALCEAVFQYCPERGAKFSTFASIKIRNHLFSYCKKMYKQYKHDLDFVELLSVPEDDSYIDVGILLRKKQKTFRGVAQKGIEALCFKLQGYTNRDIARIYHVESNMVGAWISRASYKLKADKDVLELIV